MATLTSLTHFKTIDLRLHTPFRSKIWIAIKLWNLPRTLIPNGDMSRSSTDWLPTAVLLFWKVRLIRQGDLDYFPEASRVDRVIDLSIPLFSAAQKFLHSSAVRRQSHDIALSHRRLPEMGLAESAENAWNPNRKRRFGAKQVSNFSPVLEGITGFSFSEEMAPQEGTLFSIRHRKCELLRSSSSSVWREASVNPPEIGLVKET